MAGVYENIEADEIYDETPSAEPNGDWARTIETDLERELARRTPLQSVLQEARPETAADKPLRMALSAIRDNLGRRTREWRGSAKVVEQSLRQLVAAEQSRAVALQELADIESDVASTGARLTEALSSFDESDQTKDIDPLFAQSQAALDDLDRVTNDLSIAQHWCRTAWKYYADALEREQQMRVQLQSADWAA